MPDNRVLWVALPSMIGSACVASIYMGWTNFWGPALALSVAFSAYKTGWKFGLIAAIQALAFYHVMVIEPAWNWGLNKMVPVPALIAFIAAALVFGARKEEEPGNLLRSPAEVVAFLGGVGKAARWAGVDDEYIKAWIERGEIQPGWHYRLAYKARREGYVIAPKAFGLEALPLPIAATGLNSFGRLVPESRRITPINPIKR